MDISHLCGYDLTIDATGGLATVDGPDVGQQRVLHRLLTNRTGYLWHLEYGAGLPTYIGQPVVTSTLKAVITSQMALERAVQQSPPPIVAVEDDRTGVVTASIKYVDADTNLTSFIVIPLTG